MTIIVPHSDLASGPLPGRPSTLTATPFVYRDPSEIPPRSWLYERHLIRGNISLTVAPGGVGKSSLTIVQALELTTGQRLLGGWNAGPLRVWLFNLEDDRQELVRRATAAMKHHRIRPDDLEGRLFLDTGREKELILAKQERDEVLLQSAVIGALRDELKAREIDVLIVDPFVSSHQVNEMDNGKIDLVAKAWVKLAEECNCAIELVHHTRKLNGTEASSEASRGASSLINAARSARVLQRLNDEELARAGVSGDGRTYFAVKRDKANLANAGDRETYRTVSVSLGQGDDVGVVERWQKPSLFQGISLSDVRSVQQAIGAGAYRYSEQSDEVWVGEIIAETLALDLSTDKTRIKKMIEEWLKSGVLKKALRRGKKKDVPYVEAGKWAVD